MSTNSRNNKKKIIEEKPKPESIVKSLELTKDIDFNHCFDMPPPPSSPMGNPFGNGTGGGGPMDLLSKMLTGKNADYTADILTNIGKMIASRNESSSMLRLSGNIDGSKIDIEINSPLTATLASMVLEEQGKKFTTTTTPTNGNNNNNKKM